jgi:O-Antigen ligase
LFTDYKLKTLLTLVADKNMKKINNTIQGFFTPLGFLLVSTVVFAQNFLSAELLSPLFVMIALLILMVSGRVKIGYLKMVWPLVLVFLLGITGVKDHETLDILRDIAYALTPISLLYIGYWIAGNDAMRPHILKILLTFGFVLAMIHLAKFIQNPTLLGADLGTVRREAGLGSSLVVLSLVLGVFQNRLGVGNLFPRLLPRVLALPVLLASFVLSYSRTGFMLAIILSLALAGILSRVKFRSILVVCLIIIGFAVMVATTPEGEEKTFRGKLSRSATEIAIDESMDLKDINANWRGYETYRVLDSFVSGDLLQKMVGQGAGALVDLGFIMKLADENFRYIPIFHNGYAYILIKTGLLGIACYFFFYLRAIRFAVRRCNSSDNEQAFLSRLLLGSILCLAVSMFVVGGMAEIHDAEFVLLSGYLASRTLQNSEGKICSSTDRPKKKIQQEPPTVISV